MEREKKEANDVKARHVDVLKSVNHHRINVGAIEQIEFKKRKLRIEFAGGEMEKMKDDEREDNESADDHVTRGPAGLDKLPVDVRLGAGAAIFDCEQDGEIDMQNHRNQQEDTDEPEQRA